MKHVGNVGLFGLFLALLMMPLIGFGSIGYDPSEPIVLPAESVRFVPAVVDEARETTQTTEATLSR